MNLKLRSKKSDKNNRWYSNEQLSVENEWSCEDNAKKFLIDCRLFYGITDEISKEKGKKILIINSMFTLTSEESLNDISEEKKA